MMKLNVFLKTGIILIVTALFLFTGNLFANKGKKLALIIAVAHYPAEGGWSQISSDQDIKLIETSLLAQQFKGENIEVIIDEEANKAGIFKALNTLKDKVNEGDIVVIHYSGHGQQIMDNNDDEVDGYDEALIPFDAHVRFKKGVYAGENHLRDEELGEILNEISKKAGGSGDLLVILDACHSGTGTRGFGKSRGTAQRFESEGYSPSAKSQENESSLMEIPKSRGGNDLTNAPITVISGARQNELNYEYKDKDGKYYGSLSYAISKILTSADGDMTYRALFDVIESEMSVLAPKQSPQIEGDLDRKIFGGAAVDQKPYFKVNEYFDDKNCSLKAGLLMGLNDNSIVEFHDINTNDPTKSTAKSTGTIINTSAVECDIVLETPLTKEDMTNSWVFVKTQNYGRQKISVKININKNKDLEKAVIENLKSLETVEIVDESAELIIDELVQTRGTNSYELITADEWILYSSESSSSNQEFVENVRKEIKSYAQVSLLRNLSMTDRNIDVSFEIIPITVKKAGSRFVEDKRLDINSISNEGTTHFTEGDAFKIKVVNKGYSPAYFQILDIQANNDVALLVPNGNRKAEEYRIFPKDSMELREIFVFGKPFGKEMFKLIATEDPANLSGIISVKGNVGHRGSMSDLEILFTDSYVKMRAGTISASPSSANIHSKLFMVSPQK